MPQNRTLVTVLFVTLIAAITAHAADAPKGKVITDPAVAARDIEFRLQGEYEIDCCGAQVIALGDGKFHAVWYEGGLPGVSWARGDAMKQADGELKGDAVTFDGGFKGTLKDGELVIADKGTFKKVERKSPTLGAKPPAGAVVLFDGKLDKMKGSLDGDLLTEGSQTVDKYGSFTLHLEFRTPFKPAGKGQDRGNSGVYIHNRYEVQVLDSFGLEGAFNECGSLYRFQQPTVNMALPPLSWQSYDIDFTAAKFDAAGKKTANARITVRHNGFVVQDNVELPKGTGAGGGKPEVAEEVILLQGHGNPVRYRNIWLVPK